MKTKHLLLILLSFSSYSFSQITINSTHLPVVKDTLRMSRAVMDASIDFQSTGADFTWDFSNLQNNDQKLNTYSSISSSGSITQFIFGSMAAAKHKASYYLPNEDLPLNNLPAALPITFSDINQFIKNHADSMTLVGLSMKVNGQEIPAKADTVETKYKFPMNFGDAHVGRSYINLDLNPIYNAIWRQHRKRTTEVDGWGEITTPFGTYTVLRIHHRIEESDSFKVAIGPFNNWIGIPVPLVHEYEWRAMEEKEPILLIKTTETNGTETVTAIEYRNEFMLGLAKNELNFNLYPNPATHFLTVEAKSNMDNFEIITMDGRVAIKGELNGTYSNLDIQSLKSGSYLLRISSAGNYSTQRFVKN